MVTKYKDIRRVTTENIRKTDFNIRPPDNRGAQFLAESIAKASEKIGNVAYKIGQERAMTQAKNDQAKSKFEVVDGMPVYTPMELGGTIYNNAYNEAARISYLNALENSVSEKMTDIQKKIYDEEGARYDINKINNLIDSTFTGMQENIAPEFKKELDVIIKDKVEPFIKTTIKENANLARSNTIRNLDDSIRNLTNRASLYKKGSQEYKDIIEKIGKTILTANSVNPGIYDKEKINSILLEVEERNWSNNFLNEIFTLYDKQDEEKKVTTKTLMEVHDAIQSGGDLPAIPGINNGKPLTAEDIKEKITGPQVLKDMREKLATKINYVLRHSTVEAEVTTTLNTTLSEVIPKLEQALASNDRETIDTIITDTEKAWKALLPSDGDVTAKQYLSIKNSINAELFKIKAYQSQIIINDNAEKIKTKTKNTERKLTATINNRDSFNNTLTNNENIFNTLEYNNAQKWLKTPGNFEKNVSIVNTFSKMSANKLKVVKSIIEGNITEVAEEDRNTKIPGLDLTPIELYDLYDSSIVRKAVIDNIDGILQSRAGTTSLSAKVQNIISTLTTEMSPEEITNIALNSSKADIKKAIQTLNINWANPSERDIGIIGMLAKNGFPLDHVGDIVKQAIQTNNLEVVKNIGLNLTQILQEENIPLGQLNFDDKTYTLLSFLSEIDPNIRTGIDMEKVLKVLASEDESWQVQGLGDLYMALDISTPSAEDFLGQTFKKRRDIIGDHLMALVYSDVKKAQEDDNTMYLPFLRKAVENFVYNEIAIGHLYNGTKTIKDNIPEEILKLVKEKGKGHYGAGQGAIYGATHISEDFTANSNSIKNQDVSSPYYNLEKSANIIAKLVDNPNYKPENVLVNVDIVSQINNQNGELRFDNTTDKDNVNWFTLIKSQTNEDFAKLIENTANPGGIKVYNDIVAKIRGYKKDDKSMLQKSRSEVWKTITSYTAIEGDIAGNLHEDGNLIDTLSIDKDLPGLLGVNLFLVPIQGTVDKYNVLYKSVTADGQAITIPLTVKDSETNALVEVTKSKDHSTKLQNLNIGLRGANLKEDSTKYGAPDLAHLPNDDPYALNKHINKASKLPSLKDEQLDYKEKSMINYHRSSILFRMDNIEKSNYIIRKDGKHYLVPAYTYEHDANQNNKTIHKLLEKEEAYEYFKNTPFIISFENPIQANRVKEIIEQDRFYKIQ